MPPARKRRGFAASTQSVFVPLLHPRMYGNVAVAPTHSQ